MQGGEIFIPKIPSMKVADLAEVVAPEATIKKIGIRPGEKLNEVLLTPEESRHSKELDKHYIIEPEHPFWRESGFNGKSLPEGFRYSSDSNEWWLSKEELRKMLGDL